MLKINAKTTGFGSPAESYVNKRLDLNDLISNDPMTTYYFRYAGDEKLGIKPNDVLVVDRAVNPNINDIVLIKKDKITLEQYHNQPNIWGTVTWILNQIKK